MFRGYSDVYIALVYSLIQCNLSNVIFFLKERFAHFLEMCADDKIYSKFERV